MKKRITNVMTMNLVSQTAMFSSILFIHGCACFRTENVSNSIDNKMG